MQVANPNRAQFTKCARTAIPYTTSMIQTRQKSGRNLSRHGEIIR